MDAESKPDQATIDRIKMLYPDRDVSRIIMSDASGDYPFLMTSPMRQEWKKFRKEMAEAAGNLDKIEDAIERATLAQIRWPERTEVQALFERKPGMIQNFADELAKLSGAHAEAQVKKL